MSLSSPLQMIFPWMFEEIYALRHFRDAANVLAEKTDWPPLYDIESLNKNKVCSAGFVILFLLLNRSCTNRLKKKSYYFLEFIVVHFSREKLQPVLFFLQSN